MSLRARLAALGFAAIYLPVLLLFGVSSITEDEHSEVRDGVEVTTTAHDRSSAWTTWTVVALAPAAAALAWWWAGRAVRPIDRVRRVAEDIEASDLTRRIGLDQGPAEVVALAGSFDAMLDRLEQAAETQRRLVEETSHELRTPLAVLVTNAEVLLAHPGPDLADYRAGLERSRAAAERLQATIDALLVEARGRARSLDRRPADLAAIARSVVEEAGVLAAARSVELRLDAPVAVERPLDEPTVRRAVLNLVDNAVRHAPPGTVVAVEVTPEGSVRVTDHGPGIPAEQQDRIFERFWRGGDGNGGGTGLGLPIVAQVARAHGGTISVTSPGPAGNGAVFELRL